MDRVAQLAPATRGAGGGDVLDLVIVGAGPAGLTAAAAARERGLSHVVLEQEGDLGGTIFHYPRRKLVLVQAVEVPILGRLREGEYAKEDLLAILQDLCRRGDLQVRFGERVQGLERHGGRLLRPQHVGRDPLPVRRSWPWAAGAPRASWGRPARSCPR